jgi:hypothetical protein
MHGCCGDCRAGQDRSGGAKRQDSGNKDSSPGTHDFLHANPEARGLWRRPTSPRNVPAAWDFPSHSQAILSGASYDYLAFFGERKMRRNSAGSLRETFPFSCVKPQWGRTMQGPMKFSSRLAAMLVMRHTQPIVLGRKFVPEKTLVSVML